VVLSEFSAVALENKDRCLMGLVEKICSRCSLDPVTFKSLWLKEGVEWEQFVLVCKETCCNNKNTEGLKQLIVDARDVQ